MRETINSVLIVLTLIVGNEPGAIFIMKSIAVFWIVLWMIIFFFFMKR